MRRGAVRSHSLAIHRMLGWLKDSGEAVRAILRGVAHHTGLPIVLVAAILLVASWGVIRHRFALAVKVALAVSLLLVATQLGWIRW